MSGLAGVLHLNGRPATAGDVSALLDAQAHRGPDGARALATGRLALGVSRLQTAAGEPDLLSTADGLAAAIDGRIDDRRHLAAALGCAGARSGLELVLEGYRRWGVQVAERLVGEFALILWDAPRRRLVLLRDVMGVRPLCYRTDGARLLIASEPQALARITGCDINEGFLAEHLAGDVASRDETVFAGVYRLPPGEVLVHDGTLRRSRFWPPAIAPLRYRRPAEYVDHFRHLLRAAVADRLPAGGAALALSSGIDSSIVAAEVAALRDEGDPRAAATTMLTLTHPGRTEDETDGAAATAVRLALPWRAVAMKAPPEAHFAADAQRARDLPEPPTAASALPLREAVRGSGHRVVLTGYGGDEWFSHPGESSTLAAWHRLPRPVRRGLRRLLRRSRVPPWIEPRFAASVGLHERLGHYEPEVVLPTWSTTALVHDAMHGELQWRREMSDRLAAWGGFEERSPLFDRRVIEFACAIPDEVRGHGGVGKWILRQVHRDALPAALATPPAPAGFNWVVADCLDRFGGAARLERSHPVRRGWVIAPALRSMYGELRRGREGRALPLWDVLAVDVFLQATSTQR